MSILLGVEIDGASGAAAVIKFDAVNVGVRANLAMTGFFSNADSGGERAGLGADFASKREAKTAVDTGAASGMRLRENRHGRRKRIPAKLPRGAFKYHAGRFHRQRRHGVR